MKRILLLLVAITAFNCSSDDSNAVTNNANNGISLVFVEEYCGDVSCSYVYDYKNESSVEKKITAKFSFNKFDNMTGGEFYIKEITVLPNFTERYSFSTDNDVDVVSFEVINVEIIQE